MSSDDLYIDIYNYGGSSLLCHHQDRNPPCVGNNQVSVRSWHVLVLSGTVFPGSNVWRLPFSLDTDFDRRADVRIWF